MINEISVFVGVGDEEGAYLDGARGTEVEDLVDDVVDLGVGEARAVEFGRFYFPVGEAAASEEALWEVRVTR